ncbi:hypothetical protein BLOT_007380 [Blomia tropicalis]|nr:hypothetical protein BLOT_007380 [Blomia tropicalis]
MSISINLRATTNANSLGDFFNLSKFLNSWHILISLNAPEVALYRVEQSTALDEENPVAVVKLKVITDI